jgi:hypothetical protein
MRDGTEEGGNSQFARYLVHQISDGHFSSGSSSDTSGDDDDEPAWLGESHFISGDFDLNIAASTPSNTRTQAVNGFDDAFDPTSTGEVTFGTTFNGDSDEDDTFSPFSDSNAAPSSEFRSDISSGFSFPESSSGSFSDDDDGFGEFHSADSDVKFSIITEAEAGKEKEKEEGELTPKRKWSFENDFGEGDDDDGQLVEKMEKISLNDDDTDTSKKSGSEGPRHERDGAS